MPKKKEDVEAKYDVVINFPNLELHSAAASGNVGLVHYALTHGQPVNSVLHGVLPLHAACSGGSVPVVRMLLERGADVNAPRLPRRYSDGKKSNAPSVGTAGSTPLHFAAANGHAPIVQILLTCGAVPDIPDKNGMTPEALAEINGHSEVIRTLRVWEHLQIQEARSASGEGSSAGAGPSSERQDQVDLSSPASIHSGLPETHEPENEPVTFVPSRKGKEKERSQSFASARSDTSGAVRVKKSLEGFFKRGHRGSTASDAPTPLRISVGSDGSTSVSHKDLSPVSPAIASPHLITPDDHDQWIDSIQTSGKGEPIDSMRISGQGGPEESLDRHRYHREHSADSANTVGSSTVLGLAPSLSEELSLYEEAIDDTESVASIYEAAMDFQESRDTFGDRQQSLRQPDTENDNMLNNKEITDASNETEQNSSPNVDPGPAPRAYNLATIPQEKHPRTSRRPSLPSIFEKAVHPGQAFRAAMRREKHSPEHKAPSIAEETHKSNSTSFFRGRHRDGHSPTQPGRKSGKTSIKGLFRRGHSPPSRSPSPPHRTTSGKAMEPEEIDEGIEKIKRASLELERNGITEIAPDPPVVQMPHSAPAVKTRFFEDLDESNELRLAALASLAPRESKPVTVIQKTPSSPGNRSRTGSGVLVPSPLANEWAKDQSDSDTPTSYPVRRSRTDPAKSGTNSPNSRRSLPSTPHPTSTTKRRSATLPSVPRSIGAGWEDEADLRKVAADGVIRRHSEKMLQRAFSDDSDDYHSSEEGIITGPPLAAALETDPPGDTPRVANVSEHSSEGEDTAQEGDDDVTPEATPLNEREEPEFIKSELSYGRYRGASIGSVTTSSTHLSTPSASTFPRTTSVVSGETGSERGYPVYTIPPRYTADGKMPPPPPPSVVTGLNLLPRGRSVSSNSSSTSSRAFSNQQHSSTPGTSFSPTSALSSAAGPSFPPVPEHEIATQPIPRRTVSSRAEARDLLKQNEEGIMQLAQLPPSIDSSRSLAAQLAAYGDSHALEQEFAERERLLRKQKLRKSERSVSEVDTYLTAPGAGVESESGSAGSSSGRTTGSSALQMTTSRQRAAPSLMEMSKSPMPSINNIYDKRANAYRERMQALTAIQPVMGSSSNDPRSRPRAVTSPTSSHWPGGPPTAARKYSSSSSHFEPAEISGSVPASLSMTVSEAQSRSENRSRRVKTGASKYTLHASSPPGAQPKPKSISASLSAPPPNRPSTSTSTHKSLPHRRATSPPLSTRSTTFSHPPPPIADILQTRFQGIPPTNPPISASPYVSIFSSRYSGHPHDGGESDDTDEEPQRYTVIENDWRGGHIVESGLEEKGRKKWGLRGVGFGRK